jgi:hypothetical protein
MALECPIIPQNTLATRKTTSRQRKEKSYHTLPRLVHILVGELPRIFNRLSRVSPQ